MTTSNGSAFPSTLVSRARAGRARRREVVVGVDLARGGWAVVVLEEKGVVESFRCDTFAEAVVTEASVIAVDIPIGIPDQGARLADVAARRFVGPPARVERLRHTGAPRPGGPELRRSPARRARA